jgi:hypothetical protein
MVLTMGATSNTCWDGGLSKEKVDSIMTFLKALAAELPKEYIQEPALPKSTDRTPQPDKT